MSESQSRYGILNELNTKKLAEIQGKRELEQMKAHKLRNIGDQEMQNSTQIEGITATYKTQHLHWVKMKQLELVELEKKYEADKQGLDQSISEREDTYEGDFKAHVERLKQTNKNLARESKDITEDLDRQIKTKEDIIKEIEKSITSIKEISRESKPGEE